MSEQLSTPIEVPTSDGSPDDLDWCPSDLASADSNGGTDPGCRGVDGNGGDPPEPRTGLIVSTFGDYRRKWASRGPAGWILEGIFRDRGVVLLVGLPNAGKTRFIAALAATMTLGGDLAGRKVAPGLLMYTCIEHDPDDIVGTFNEAAIGVGLDPEDDAIAMAPIEGFDFDDEDKVKELCREADRLDAMVIVVDSLRRATSANENLSDEVREVMNRARLLTGNGKRLVILVHHLDKRGGVRGSTDFVAATDAVITLKARDGTKIELTIEGKRQPKSTLKIEVVESEGGYRLESAESGDGDGGDEVQEWAMRLAMFNAIKENPGDSKTKVRDAARKTKKVRGRNEAFDAAIDWLSAEGHIENGGKPTNQKWHAVSERIEIPGEMLARIKQLRG